MRIIKFYKNSIGNCPVEDFLDLLPAKQAQKASWVMNLVEELDMVPETYLKKLINTDNIWEIRVQLGSDILRILGFFINNIFIATNGFCKKSQKTPSSEIKPAENRKLEYINRGRNLE